MACVPPVEEGQFDDAERTSKTRRAVIVRATSEARGDPSVPTVTWLCDISDTIRELGDAVFRLRVDVNELQRRVDNLSLPRVASPSSSAAAAVGGSVSAGSSVPPLFPAGFEPNLHTRRTNPLTVDGAPVQRRVRFDPSSPTAQPTTRRRQRHCRLCHRRHSVASSCPEDLEVSIGCGRGTTVDP